MENPLKNSKSYIYNALLKHGHVNLSLTIIEYCDKEKCIEREVTDITNNTTTSYDSIGEAARALNLPSHKAISDYIKNNKKKPYKGRYTFKKL